MGRKLPLFFAALVTWCLLNWVPDRAHLLVGVVVASIVAYAAGDFVVQRPEFLRNPQRYLYFLFLYVPVLLWEVLKANIDVACRVVHPSLPIKPGIVKVEVGLRSDIACTLLANSITLTPGTLSVDIDKDRAVLYVHWIDVGSQDMELATRTIVERFEKILRLVFEKEAKDGES